MSEIAQVPKLLVGQEDEELLNDVINMIEESDGNKFSLKNRLYELNINERNGYTLDSFVGVFWGAFPYFDVDVYQANVHDYKI